MGETGLSAVGEASVIIASVVVILKIVFDFVRTRNGSAPPTKSDFSKILGILEQQTEILESMKIQSILTTKEISELKTVNIGATSKIDNIAGALAIAMERQMTTTAIINEINKKRVSNP